MRFAWSGRNYGVVYSSPWGRPENGCLFILPWLAPRRTGLGLKRTVGILSWVALKKNLSDSTFRTGWLSVVRSDGRSTCPNVESVKFFSLGVREVPGSFPGQAPTVTVRAPITPKMTMKLHRFGLKTYLNGFKILEYLHVHEMCFTCYDFSFKKAFNVD